MDFETKMTGMLIDNGMFDSQAKEVIEAAKIDDICEAMKDRWHSDVSGYPAMMTTVFWLSVKTVAAKWIEENAPDAWFKPMFADDT